MFLAPEDYNVMPAEMREGNSTCPQGSQCMCQCPCNCRNTTEVNPSTQVR